VKRASTPTRDRILQAAYNLFYEKGFSRVGVDAVAKSAGLTKRTLYQHFRSKDNLLAAVLERQSGFALASIEGWGQRLPEDCSGFVQQLFRDAARWASSPKWAGAGFTRLVMKLADLPGHPARAVARRHKTASRLGCARSSRGAGSATRKRPAAN
jgi:AcrR family transcriptional regulator